MNTRQTTDTLLMIRPVSFTANTETGDNVFQETIDKGDIEEVQQKAQKEFDDFVQLLKNNGIEVMVVEDTAEPKKPDAIFPNNWVSFHQSGAVMTYPMYSRVRRGERREDIIENVMQEYDLQRRYSMEQYEENDLFLESTGSMVLDRQNKIIYACISERTNVTLIDKFCVLMGYRRIVFEAVDSNGIPIYHTNVLMGLGENFVVICTAAIVKAESHQELKTAFETTGKEVVEISFDQMEKFLGNLLQVKNKSGESFIVMSTQAFHALKESQRTTLEKYGKILHSPLNTIEKYGGGSARCMMAEIFYPAMN